MGIGHPARPAGGDRKPRRIDRRAVPQADRRLLWRAQHAGEQETMRCVASLLMLTMVAAPIAGAADAVPKDNPLNGTELTPEVRAAIDKGLEALSHRQEADGSFGVTIPHHA